MSLYGIDVSYAQGNIDWTQVVTDKDFAIVRAGYGRNNIDAKAANNVSECNRLNFPVGLYWFSYAYTVQMAEDEGTYATQFASSYNLNYPIYWDFEYDSLTYAENHGVTMTTQLFHAMMNAFCTAVENAGYDSGIYYNPDFDSRYSIASFFQQYPSRSKWVAKWSTTPPADYNIWQYGISNAGDVPGISGQVDLDVIDGTPVPPTPPTPTPTNDGKMPIWFYLRPY